MTKEKLELLNSLIVELHNERMNELVKQYGDEIYDYDDQELYELDDGDNCIQGCDIIADVTVSLMSKAN
jgi:hypothetical protein